MGKSKDALADRIYSASADIGDESKTFNWRAHSIAVDASVATRMVYAKDERNALVGRRWGSDVYKACAITCFLLIVAIPPSYAAESDNVGLGAGVATCRQFAEFRKLEYGPTMLHFTAWAHGFMSAMNLNTYESIGTFRELSPDVSLQQSFYIDFCDKFPDRPFVTAVRTLYETFPVRMKR